VQSVHRGSPAELGIFANLLLPFRDAVDYFRRHSCLLDKERRRMLSISGKALGRKKPLFDDYSVPPPADLSPGEAITLRQLISHVVRAEVTAFKERQAERRLLKALSAREIAEGLASGKVDSGGSDLNQPVDPEQAVATAIEAFGDGLYLVVVDGQEVKSLDAPITLSESSQLTFIRLTMLAGG
jgi:hypothetical protein